MGNYNYSQDRSFITGNEENPALGLSNVHNRTSARDGPMLRSMGPSMNTSSLLLVPFSAIILYKYFSYITCCTLQQLSLLNYPCWLSKSSELVFLQKFVTKGGRIGIKLGTGTINISTLTYLSTPHPHTSRFTKIDVRLPYIFLRKQF